MKAETLQLLDVTRKHTRAASRQLRALSGLYAQLADELDLEYAASTAKPKEAQRHEHDQDERADS